RPSQGLPRTGTDATDEVTIARTPLDDALSGLGDEGDVTPPPAAVPLDAVVSRAPGGVQSAIRKQDEETPLPPTESGPTTVRSGPATIPPPVAPATRESGSDLARSLTFSDALEPELVYELDEPSRPGTDGELLLVASPPPVPVAPPPTPEPRKTPSALGQVAEPPPEPESPIAGPPRRSRAALWAALGVVLVGGGVTAALWQPWASSGARAVAPLDAPVVKTHPKDPAIHAAVADAAIPDAAIAIDPHASPADAAPVAAAPVDAGTRPPDAGVASSAPPTRDDSFAIASTPSGAAVFLDGADQGKTPITITAAADKHTLVIVKPGYELFVQEVDGRHPVTANLVEATPTGGPAGIKVKCTKRDRYYVFVDGHGTGMLCPTERIHVDLGTHTVEVYDVVTDARTQYPVVVKDTRNSLRVKLD
ncbi:MAG: PEGA domain-containing protein, partial [Deltaproteobacteria bacterium]|nr:PEGA domain-containing protein [Deltaproteobacteria bacterium]